MINQEFPIAELFAGTPKPFGERGQLSAIAKVSIPGPWEITKAGLRGDQQADQKHHGGPDKALHHYSADHYEVWCQEFPHRSTKFVRSAFGENVSTFGFTEHDVCIGDVFRLGCVQLQISQGRQPCWKLNAQFSIGAMALHVQNTGRTGWYYRVLQPGIVEPGDKLKLIDRPHVIWPLSRAIELLYQRVSDFGELKELSELPELSENWKTLVSRRVARQEVEDWTERVRQPYD